MSTRKILLTLPLERPHLLERYVLDWVAAGVGLIWLFGEGADQIHDQIDWIMISSGFDPDRLPVTNSNELPASPEDLSYEEVLRQVEDWKTDQPSRTEVLSF